MGKKRLYTVLFCLSFFAGCAFLLTLEYVSGTWWADQLFVLFLLSSGYQLAYLFHFRKKDGVGFGRALANAVRFALLVLLGVTVFELAEDYFCGYRDYTFMRYSYTEYFGWEAVKKDTIICFLLRILLGINLLYNAVFFIADSNIS